MAHIPTGTQPEIFQPQDVTAPTQGFQALQKLFGGVAEIAGKLNDEQIEADKLVGSNQIQTSLRKIQQDAALKFPGQYAKQAAFYNQAAQSFTSNFISGSIRANRTYFQAISKNVLTNTNFSYARNIQAETLKAQKVAFDNIYNQLVVNTVDSIRNGGTALTKENIGRLMINLNNLEKGSVLTPAAKENYQQNLLMSVQLAASKNSIDGALAEGGITAARASLASIISDKNNPLLANARTAPAFTSAIKAYTNGVTGALSASQSANKGKINDVLNNTRLTGHSNTQVVSSLGIEVQNAAALAVHNKAWEIFTSGALEKQKSLNALDLGDSAQLSIQKTVKQFETQYKADPMGFLLKQISKSQFGLDAVNATPEQFKQMRAAAVEIERQRGDVQIKPMTDLEMQPVIQAALSGNTDAFVSEYNKYLDSAGKFSQSALIQLGAELKHNGVDDSIETVSFFDDPKGLVPSNITKDSTIPLASLIQATAIKLNETPDALKKDVESKVRSELQSVTLFTPQREKFISSLLNSAGAKKGLALATLQKQVARYVYGTISRGANSSISGAMTQYFDAIGGSFNYAKQRDGQFIRIPLKFEGKPLDSNKVRDVLSNIQSNLKMKDVDLSEVVGPLTESTAETRQRYWNTNGSYNSWMTGPDGESYYLKSNDGIVLKSKITGQDIRVTNNQIFNSPEQPQETKRKKELTQKDETIAEIKKSLFVI